MREDSVVVAEALGIAVGVPKPPPSLFSYPHRLAASGDVVRRLQRKRLFVERELEISPFGRVNSWVDAMKSSSPTQAKAAAAAASLISSVHHDAMKRQPSALDMFDEFIAQSKGKQIVMFLDYDGTLSPIVQDPDKAFMSESMKAALSDVARYFPTAIVTGRCLDKVLSFVGLDELYYAGSHGMDIKGPAADAKTVLFQPAKEFLPMINKVYTSLVDKTHSIPGAIVEHNKFCISVHFRCVHDKKLSSLAHQVFSVLKAYPKLRLTHGRKVLEIRPSIKWDKGKALLFLLESLGYANCRDIFPVYIGDDRTDEDAFKVLKDRGEGLGIIVSKFAKETKASYSLQDPSEVKDFLQKLVHWKRTPL